MMTELLWHNLRNVKFMIGIPEEPTDAEIARVLLFFERFDMDFLMKHGAAVPVGGWEPFGDILAWIDCVRQ